MEDSNIASIASCEGPVTTKRPLHIRDTTPIPAKLDASGEVFHPATPRVSYSIVGNNVYLLDVASLSVTGVVPLQNSDHFASTCISWNHIDLLIVGGAQSLTIVPLHAPQLASLIEIPHTVSHMCEIKDFSFVRSKSLKEALRITESHVYLAVSTSERSSVFIVSIHFSNYQENGKIFPVATFESTFKIDFKDKFCASVRRRRLVIRDADFINEESEDLLQNFETSFMCYDSMARHLILGDATGRVAFISNVLNAPTTSVHRLAVEGVPVSHVLCVNTFRNIYAAVLVDKKHNSVGVEVFEYFPHSYQTVAIAVTDLCVSSGVLLSCARVACAEERYAFQMTFQSNRAEVVTYLMNITHSEYAGNYFVSRTMYTVSVPLPEVHMLRIEGRYFKNVASSEVIEAESVTFMNNEAFLNISFQMTAVSVNRSEKYTMEAVCTFERCFTDLVSMFTRSGVGAMDSLQATVEAAIKMGFFSSSTLGIFPRHPFLSFSSNRPELEFYCLFVESLLSLNTVGVYLLSNLKFHFVSEVLQESRAWNFTIWLVDEVKLILAYIEVLLHYVTQYEQHSVDQVEELKSMREKCIVHIESERVLEFFRKSKDWQRLQSLFSKGVFTQSRSLQCVLQCAGMLKSGSTNETGVEPSNNANNNLSVWIRHIYSHSTALSWARSVMFYIALRYEMCDVSGIFSEFPVSHSLQCDWELLSVVDCMADSSFNERFMRCMCRCAQATEPLNTDCVVYCMNELERGNKLRQAVELRWLVPENVLRSESVSLVVVKCFARVGLFDAALGFIRELAEDSEYIELRVKLLRECFAIVVKRSLESCLNMSFDKVEETEFVNIARPVAPLSFLIRFYMLRNKREEALQVLALATARDFMEDSQLSALQRALDSRV